MENTDIKPAVQDDDSLLTNAKIKVIGVGGGGSNAVNTMLHDKEDLVDYWVMNTDSQALSNSPCENKMMLGRNVTKGLGAGGNPDMGKKAAEDSANDIGLVVQGSDMVFIAVGEGGGTGTGAAPVIAKAAKDAGCLVLAVVTRPFHFEGKKRSANALEGITELSKYVDALIVVSNDYLMLNKGDMALHEAFTESDQILASSVKTVTDLILVHGIINLDFADVKTTLSGRGLSLIGIGVGQGKNKAIDAATQAIDSPLLEASIKGARQMLINVTVGDDTSLNDVQDAIDFITDAAGDNADNDVNIIFGVQEDKEYQGKMKVALIATDFVKGLDLTTEPLLRSKPVEVAPAPAPLPVPKPKEDANAFLPDYLKTFLQTQDSSASECAAPAAPAVAPANVPSSAPASETGSITIPIPQDTPAKTETPVHTDPAETVTIDIPVEK
jgi:cell division protein FtsZ